MIKEIINELYYQVKSYMIFICMIVVIGCSIYAGYMQIKNVESSYDIVRTVKEQVQNISEDALEQNSESVLNEVIQKYYSSKVALNKENAINQYFSSIMIFALAGVTVNADTVIVYSIVTSAPVASILTGIVAVTPGAIRLSFT